MNILDFTPETTPQQTVLTQPDLNAPISEWQQYWKNKRKPQRTSLQEQAKTSLGVSDSKVAEMQAVTPQATPDQEEYTPIDVNTKSKEYISALEAILAANKPDVDPEKEKRYKQRSAVNSVGNALKQVFTAVQEHNGYNVKPETNPADASTAAYAKLLDENKAKLKSYNDMLMQAKLSGLNHKMQLEDANEKFRYQFYSDKQKRELDRQKNRLEAAKFTEEMQYKYEALNQKDRREVDKLIQNGEIAKAKNKLTEKQIAATNYRTSVYEKAAQSKAENKNLIPFNNDGVDDAISVDDVNAIANVALDDLYAKFGDDTFKRDNDFEFQLMLKAANGGLNANEMKLFVPKYYNKYKDKAKAYSQNDAGRQAPQQSQEVKTGWESTIPQPTQKNQASTKKIDPKKYGGYSGFTKK